MKSRPLFLLVVSALLGTFAIAAEPNPNALTAAEQAGGWKLLFDGKTMEGWRGYKTVAPGAGWKAVDGTLSLSGKAGDLLTTEEFGDFELSFQWKVTETANSGVIYRVGLGETAPYVTGPEYQVLDNDKASDNKQYNHLAGSLYDIALQPGAKTKAVGAWNEGKIRVVGWHVEHWLNGDKVVDIDLASVDGKKFVEASKFKTWTKFASLPRGHIALQEHGHDVSFRAIKVRAVK